MTRNTPSIRAQLLTRLIAGLALAIVIATIATYLRAREEANELFDLQLKQTAASITGMPLATIGQAGAAEGLVVQVWDRNGVRVFLPPTEGSSHDDAMPGKAMPGFATIDTPSGAWRVYSVLANGQLVQVGQRIAVRRDLAASLALRTVVPLAVAAPFVLLIVGFAITRGLAPITRLAAAVERRTPAELSPLAEHGWPREAVPLVGALNGLLARLNGALDAQRAFIADAAHELRTPLTALHLQAQLAARASTDGERFAAVHELKRGLARVTRMVEQLLALAREEPGVSEPMLRPVDLAALAREIVGELSPLASAKTIDVGVAAPESTIVRGDDQGLRTLLSNLVDNAIRYAAPGGRVDVVVDLRPGAAVLSVRDDGPGIAPAERERVFDRFVRGSHSDVEGTGLGLAIVRKVADRHGATVRLGDGIGGRGLSVEIAFPPAASAGAPAPLHPGAGTHAADVAAQRSA